MEPAARTGLTAMEQLAVAAPAAERRQTHRIRTLLGTAPGDGLAVVLAGSEPAARTAVLTALLENHAPAASVPDGSFLVLGYGTEETGAAYVPGYREAYPYRARPLDAGPALARPPRRVELAVAHPLLRHFHLVDAPDLGSLGEAGRQVLVDAATRGGALLLASAADARLGPAERDVLTRAATAGVQVFLVVTPAGTPAGADPPAGRTGRPAAGADPAGGDAVAGSGAGPVSEETLAALRAALPTEVPALAGTTWTVLGAGGAAWAAVRDALTDWASLAGVRRDGARPPAPLLAGHTVRVVPGAYRIGWAEHLDRRARTEAHRIRQHLAIELANIHLRAVQEIVFGTGCAGLPAILDRELHALSLGAVRECADGADRLVDEAIGAVFGAGVSRPVRQRVVAAARQRLSDHRGARDLDRVLLVTSTAGVAVMTGTAAVSALAAYHDGEPEQLLPPMGIGLSGGCYQYWRNPGNADQDRARTWLQRALREVELELLREVSRRFEAARRSLTALLGDAVEHGILLT